MFSKILGALGYIVLYLFTLLLFTYWTFPLERLKDYIVVTSSQSEKYRLEIEEIDREGMGALVFTGVRVGIHRKMLKRPGSEAAAKKGPAKAPGAMAPKADDIKEEGSLELEGIPGKRSKSAKAALKSGKGDSKSDDEDEGNDEEVDEEADEEADEETKEIITILSSDEFSFIPIDYIRVSYDVFDLITYKEFTIGLYMELLDGVVEGGEIEVKRVGEQTRTAIRLPEITGVELGEAEVFGVLFSALLPTVRTERVEGTLDRGSIVVEPEEEEGLPYSSGRVELEFSGIVANSPLLVSRVRNMPPTEVPLTDMYLGKCIFNVRIDNKDNIDELNRVKDKSKDKDKQATKITTAILFEKGECKGNSLDYYIRENSYVLLPSSGKMVDGKMELWTKLAFSPSYFDEKKVEDGEVMTRNQELGKGLEFDPLWQEAQDVDGYYWMHCQGSLGQPRCKRELPPDEKSKKDAKREADRLRRRMNTPEAKPATRPTRPEVENSRGGTGGSAGGGSIYDRRREAAKERSGGSEAEVDDGRGDDRRIGGAGPAALDRPQGLNSGVPTVPVKPQFAGPDPGAPVDGELEKLPEDGEPLDEGAEELPEGELEQPLDDEGAENGEALAEEPVEGEGSGESELPAEGEEGAEAPVGSEGEEY